MIDSSVLIHSNIVLNRWKCTLKAGSIKVSENQGTANIAYFYQSSGEIFESVVRSLFTINKHAISNVCGPMPHWVSWGIMMMMMMIANVCLYLWFQFRIMNIKIFTFTN